jgi:hypothetical protein
LTARRAAKGAPQAHVDLFQVIFDLLQIALNLGEPFIKLLVQVLQRGQRKRAINTQ